MIRKIIKMTLKYPLRLSNYIYSIIKFRESEKRRNYIVDHTEKDNVKVLVFAPHVDDETIGLGGTLLKHSRKGAEIHLAYIADGSGAVTKMSKELLVESRKHEGIEVGKYFNCKDVYFLGYEDGKIDSKDINFINDISKLIRLVSPSIIYMPFIIDGHKDHVETTKAVVDSCIKTNYSADIYGYQVNCPIIPSLVNVITTLTLEEAAYKKQAFEIFKSQYVMGFSAFLLLDKKQSTLLNEGYSSEVFVRADTKGYHNIIEKLEHIGFSPDDFRQVSSEYNLLYALLIGRTKKKQYSNLAKDIIDMAKDSV